MSKNITPIKNADPYLLFNILPTNHKQLRLFLLKLLAVSKIEAERTISDYDGFDFDKLRAKDINGYKENVDYLENFKHRLHAIENINEKLIESNFNVHIFEFCSIYNSLFPFSYSIIDSYVNFDFDRYEKEDPESYEEHIKYLNMHRNRIDEILKEAKAKNDLFSEPGNIREDDINKNSDYGSYHVKKFEAEILKTLSVEQVGKIEITKKLRALINYGPVLVRCIKAVENKKSVICSENEYYLILVTPGFYSSPDVFIFDDEENAKKLNERCYSHFDFTPVDFDDDKSEQFYELEIAAHLSWYESMNYHISNAEVEFKLEDIVCWQDGCKDISSQIDYDMPMYICEVDKENRSVKVICNLQKRNIYGSAEQYRPQSSLRESCFVVETIPMFRISKYRQ